MDSHYRKQSLKINKSIILESIEEYKETHPHMWPASSAFIVVKTVFVRDGFNEIAFSNYFTKFISPADNGHKTSSSWSGRGGAHDIRR
jgi:hypothetical protein